MSTPSPGPVPSPSLSRDDSDHPGFVLHGEDDTPGHKAYYIHLEVKEGKQEALLKFLADINAGVDQEPLTGPWFALRFSHTTFGIFEAFPDAVARHTHDTGPGGRNFLQSELLHEMLAYPAQLYRLDVLHGKYDVMLGQQVARVRGLTSARAGLTAALLTRWLSKPLPFLTDRRCSARF